MRKKKQNEKIKDKKQNEKTRQNNGQSKKINLKKHEQKKKNLYFKRIISSFLK